MTKETAARRQTSRRPTCALAQLQVARQFRGMSREAVLYVEGSEPLPVFRDLERVTIICAATTDDGQTVPAGSEGTIVGVIKEGLAYAVEFSAPVDGLATLLPNELRPLGRAEA